MTETSTPGTSRRWRRLSLVLALLAGFAAGVLASSLFDPRHGRGRRGPEAGEFRRGSGAGDDARRRGRGGPPGEGRAERFREHLESALDLDESQRARLGEFLERNHEEASAFWEATRERYRELRLRFRGQIREMLDDEQRATFDDLFPESGPSASPDPSDDAPDEEADGGGPPRSGAFAPRHGDFR